MSPFVGALILIGVFISIVGEIILETDTSAENINKIEVGMAYEDVCRILGMSATSIHKMIDSYFIQWNRTTSGHAFHICMKFDWDYKLIEITSITKI